MIYAWIYYTSSILCISVSASCLVASKPALICKTNKESNYELDSMYKLHSILKMWTCIQIIWTKMKNVTISVIFLLVFLGRGNKIKSSNIQSCFCSGILNLSFFFLLFLSFFEGGGYVTDEADCYTSWPQLMAHKIIVIDCGKKVLFTSIKMLTGVYNSLP